MKKKLTMKINIWIVFFILVSCQKKDVLENYQKKIIKENLKGNLIYEYYEDSIIKKASEASNNKVLGYTIEFSNKGILRRKYFTNYKGEIVGDESIFNKSGSLREHFFRLNSESLLFYAKFKNDGDLDYTEGSPFFIHGKNKASLGDTISFYIATPIIPKYKTKVVFYQKKDLKTKVEYYNDIRQFNYKYVIVENKNLEFYLNIKIKDSIGNSILNYSDTINVIVDNSSAQAGILSLGNK